MFFKRRPALAVPFPRSFWVVPGKLLAGGLPSDSDPVVRREKLNALLDAGITSIINLMEVDERNRVGGLFPSYEEDWVKLGRLRGLEVEVERRGIELMGVPGVPFMKAILNKMDDRMASGNGVYLHCWGGRGRTGTVIGCWLARHDHRNPVRELKKLTAHARTHFPRLPETSEQSVFIQGWPPGW